MATIRQVGPYAVCAVLGVGILTGLRYSGLEVWKQFVVFALFSAAGLVVYAWRTSRGIKRVLVRTSFPLVVMATFVLVPSPYKWIEVGALLAWAGAFEIHFKRAARRPDASN